MKAKSIKGKSTEEIIYALEESMKDGFQPSLAFVFISIQLDRKAVCEILHDKGIDIIGATSCGEFIDGYQEQGSAVILLLNLPPASYQILFEDFANRDIGTAATKIAKDALEKFKKPAFILCSTGVSRNGEFADGEMLLQSLEKIIGPQVNIYGGMAGDDFTLSGSYTFTYEQSSDTAIAALVLDEERVSLHGMAISGWKPIGIPRTVTKSDGGLIYTIDDRPAIEMYLKYLGKEAASKEEGYKLFEDIGIHYPFHIERESGEPIMRTPIKYDSDKNALQCDFNVPQGAKLRFSMPPDLDVVEKVLSDATELKKTSDVDAEALLIFSCAGRLSSLGPLATMENEGLANIWKAPMAGFFTYGEFGRAINGRQEFHSTTCCWVALKEKS